MNSKIKKMLSSSNFMLRSRALIYNLSQFKYNQYSSLIDRLDNIVNFEISNKEYSHTIYFIDGRYKDIIKHIQNNNSNIIICCTYTCFNFINQYVKNNNIKNNIYKITMKQIYDLDIYNTNKYIYNFILPLLKDIDGLQIVVCNSDQIIKSEIINNLKYVDWNNLNGMQIYSRYILFLLSKFMNKYFLLEVGRNKQAKEKLQNRIKFLKLQLLHNNVVIKSKFIENE